MSFETLLKTDPVEECATLLRKPCENLDVLFLFLIIVIINLFSLNFEIAQFFRRFGPKFKAGL